MRRLLGALPAALWLIYVGAIRGGMVDVTAR